MRFLLISLLFVGAFASPVIVPGDSQQVLSEGSLTEDGDVFPGWYDPRQYGGRFLDVRATFIYPKNVNIHRSTQRRGDAENRSMLSYLPIPILSFLPRPASSHTPSTHASFPSVLRSLTPRRSIGFAQECLGLHKGVCAVSSLT